MNNLSMHNEVIEYPVQHAGVTIVVRNLIVLLPCIHNRFGSCRAYSYISSTI